MKSKRVYYAEGKQNECGGSYESYLDEYDTNINRLESILKDKGLTKEVSFATRQDGQPVLRYKTLEELGLIKKLPAQAKSYGVHMPASLFDKLTYSINTCESRKFVAECLNLSEQEFAILYKKVSELLGGEYISVCSDLHKFIREGRKLDKDEEKPLKNGVLPSGMQSY